MIELFTGIAPVILGFFAKLLALRSQATTDNQKLLLEAFAVKSEAINSSFTLNSKCF